jgi:RNA polymerase sigma-70 factor (ECF subfamily)
MTETTTAVDSINALMMQMRPRLHRYCARLVGSVFEGEDVVQETLAKATEALPTAGHIESVERWLFTIAHNTALDNLRRRKRHAEVPLEREAEELDPASDIESLAAASASLTTLMHLPVIQRSSVVLVDVLEYSVDETAQILDSTLAAVKAALHRGRVRLKALAEEPQPEKVALSGDELARLRAYAESFNARDFDTLRDLLAEDAKLDLVNRLRLSGRKDVSVYFGRYSESHDWRFSAGFVEGRAALVVSDPEDPTNKPTYIVLLEWRDSQIVNIRDFRWAKYIVEGMIFKPL